jgi:signal transduction histidine kinase
MNEQRPNRWQLSAKSLDARHSELLEMLEDITRLTSDWVWSLSKDFRLSFISDQFFESCGVLPVNVIGKKMTDIGWFRSSSGEILVPDLGKPFRNLAYEISATDGSTRHLLLSGLPTFSRETGAFTGVRGIGRDITNRMKAEKTSQTLIAAIEEVSEAFCLYDADDKFVMCNRRFREVNEPIKDLIETGRTFEDFIAGAANTGLVPDAVGRERDWIADRMKQHRNPGLAFEVRRQNGACFLVTEERLVDGSTATITTDITNRKDMEYALRESVRRRQVFMADVAHQLRTPLAVLNANVDSIEDADTVESLKKDISTLSRMVEGLLAETKVEDMEISTNDRSNLSLIARSVAAYLGPQAIKLGRSVEVIAPDSPVWVWGRTQALEQAVRLLVENAIEQTISGTVVTVEVTNEPAFYVEDHGARIPDEAKQRIFTLGLRADQRVEGNRPGLSAVRRIADAHGAEVGVFNGSSEGSVFYIRFPGS